MIRSIGSSQAALTAYSSHLNASANNIANINSQEYKSKDVVINEGQNSRPEAQVRTNNSPGPLRETISQEGKAKSMEMSNTDISKEMTDMVSSEKAYTANLKTIGTQSEMTGSIIDIKG
jgi:flagellar basal-body rod protein FlgC